MLTRQDFTDKVPPALCGPVAGGLCALDVVGKDPAKDVTVIKRGPETLLVGWAAEIEAGTVPPIVLVKLAPPTASKPEEKKGPGAKAAEAKKPEKAFFAAATRITKRADVAQARNTPAFVNSGYDLLSSFDNVAVGEYAVSIVQVTAGGQALVCDTTRRLKIE